MKNKGCGLMLLAIVIVSILLTLLTSCTTQKHIAKNSHEEQIVSDSTSKIVTEKTKDTENNIIFSDETEIYQQVIDELTNSLWNAGVERDSIENILKNIKPIKCPSGKIIYKVDGSVEVSGVKEWNNKIAEMQKIIDSNSVKKEVVIKDKIITKEVTRWHWWWLLIVTYILGVYLPPMKIIDKLKLLSFKK